MKLKRFEIDKKVVKQRRVQTRFFCGNERENLEKWCFFDKIIHSFNKIIRKNCFL